MYENLVKALRSTAEVNSLSLYKRGLMKQAADAISELQQIANHHEAEAKEWYLAYMNTLPERKQTNADKIRSMSDEEMANAIAKKSEDCFNCATDGYDTCRQCWLDWIKQECNT